MKTGVVFFAAVLCTGTVAAQQAPPASVDFATALKTQQRTIGGNIVKSAEKMTEADYAFKPAGVAPEVRTFGQLIIHLANANNLFCARAKGEQPKPGLDEKSAMTKADIVKAITDAVAFCQGVYDAQTNTSLVEMMKVPGPNNSQLERSRGAGLVSNIGHNNEHYGNLVTYMRAKGLVPPSSEGR
jgi:uncharacterized damage-inducible protein DinB